MASNSIQAGKAALRHQTEAALREMTPEARDNGSAVLCRAMMRQAFWQRARRVLCFAPMPGELDVWPLLLSAVAEGKSVALPRYDRKSRSYAVCAISDPGNDIVPGYFGIREPAPHCIAPSSNILDLILVPGVAFDAEGRRLGRGKGYYDRLLAAYRGQTCGVCFDEQIVESVPVEPHDVQLDCILTPTRFFHRSALNE